jgi:hypothetical protein
MEVDMADQAHALAQAIKDPDAAAAKKLLARLQALETTLIPARAGLGAVFGEGRDIAPPEVAPVGKRAIATPLGHWFFPEAETILDRIERDASVIAAQVKEMPGKI